MRRFFLAWAILCAGALALGGAALAGAGRASWYGTESGSRTANGEPFDGTGATCAHRTLRFGTILEVTNLRNGRKATCRVNDRGPFIGGRVLDVSRAVAVQLGMLRDGVVKVSFRIVGNRRAR